MVDLLGQDAVLPQAQQLDRYSVDGLVPQAVVRPADRDGVAQVLRWASTQGCAVVPRGGGTQLCLGNVPRRMDLVLDLTNLRRVLDFQPADLTATVEAGITLAVLQGELAQKEKFVPLEAPLSKQATIGGILAANTSGPLRSTYGLARDWLIGVGMVSAAGVYTKAGGKVVKNVTGYDLNKLYTGSLGTLGVIVEATFKLAPLPPAWGALTGVFPSLPRGVGAARSMQGRPTSPQAVLVVNLPVARRLDNVPGLQNGEALLLAFYSGRARAVERRLNDGVQRLRDEGSTRVEPLDGTGSLHLLQKLTDLGWTAKTTPYLGLQVNVPPAAVGDVAAHSLAPDVLGHWDMGVVADVAFGRVQLLWWAEEARRQPDDGTVLAALHRARGLAQGLKGWMVVEHCPLPVKRQVDVWGDTPSGMEVMRRLKEQFDPSGILNPGRFVGRI